MSEITFLNDSALKELKNKNDRKPIIIDVREPDEYIREHIPGSQNIPLSDFGKMNLITNKLQPVIFHCKSGNRTRLACDKLKGSGFTEMYCLDGGIEQWKRCGFSVIKNEKAPLELMRQVQIVVGSMILLGLFLSYFVSSSFILLPLAAGVGMLVAGTTGFCGMAKLLMLMPWNKR